MAPRVGILLICICALNACHTHRPPADKPATAEQTKDFIARYLSAKNSTGACDEFASLAREESFPLKELAKLRAEEACLKGPIDFASYSPWLRTIALDAAIRSASKRGDDATLAGLSIEKSKVLLTPEEKLQWANQAKELAGKVHDENLAKVAQDRIFMISPRLRPDPTEKEFLSVADDSRYHREFSKAHEFYRKIIGNKKAPVPEKISAFRGIRQSYKNARDPKAFLEANSQLIQFLEKQLRGHRSDHLLLRQLNDAFVAQTRALWTHGQIKDALKIAQKAERRLRNLWPLTDLYWLRARIAEEKNDIVTSNRYLSRALSQVERDGETRDKLRWQMAWNERRSKNFAGAESIFQQLMNETQNEATLHRAEFWLGRTKMELNQPEVARDIFDKLIQDDPLGYYGLLAYNQLARPILQQKAPTIIPPAPNITQVLRPEIADTLILVQEQEALQSYLDDIAKSYKKSKAESDDVWVRLLKYYAHAGLYIKLYENLTLISPEQRNAILANNPDLLFPRPFENLVQQAGMEMKVEPELIYSIMRQESAFNPRARSSADAFGLMQVLPEIAATLAKKYKIPFGQNEDLYDPAVNIRFGAALLREQLDKYHDQFIPAVASYNANDQAIHNWMQSRFRGDPLEFIEDIPYEETRGYVRLVMRNLVFYRLMSSPQGLQFPEWVLKLSSSN